MAVTNPQSTPSPRKRVVVVGLGMVGISFIEKLLKLDAKTQEYEVIVIGEEPHLAYNRVALTSFFQHREVEQLYMNPKDWYHDLPTGSLSYHLNSLVTEIDSANKTVKTSNSEIVNYDFLVLATGSTAILPRMPGYDATGVFVYRTIDDLQRLINFSAAKKNTGKQGVVIGGGLLGLEAAKAMLDLEVYDKITVIEAMPYVLGRQLDQEAGMMVVEQVKNLGVDVVLGKMVNRLVIDEEGNVNGVEFKDGEIVEGACVCFAIGVRARDELAKKSGLTCHERGGIMVGDDLQTSAKDVFAIGECANWNNMCYGLVGPGYEMAELLAHNMTEGRTALKSFLEPDMSTKLKLLGVEVASFGDCFADVFGPKWLPDGTSGVDRKGEVKALTYKDPFSNVYKKYLFSVDGKYLLGGMMMGDAKDYVKLLALAKSHKELVTPPGELIIGKTGGEDDADDLPDEAQICSCNNVTKGNIVSSIKDDGCRTLGAIKACTKAGTSCGGCVPLVQTIFNKTMASLGETVENFLCPHFRYSRADLFNIIMVKQLQDFDTIMNECGEAGSLGCEICKPAIGSILSSLFNKHVIDPSRKGLQDTNDRFLANIQRNGTFSVVPRVAGGEITPKKLAAIASVAEKYNLYCKITGGQRIDMFGAKKQDLLAIWTELIAGGLESGHAYAKSLRTVKSCVGTSWCRFGIGDSVGMAIRIEERYKSIRAPHKIKGAVSGCVRECAEAQNKDFGLIATERGFNIFVAGNGGAKPKHSELLATDVPVEEVIPILDRYLIFYIRTADRLQRTARWIEQLPGGLAYLKEVVLEDKLGICADMERQMEELVESYFCEWTETVKDPERRRQFQQFANVSETVETVDPIVERGQTRPSDWPREAAKKDFKNIKWKSLAWQPILEAAQFRDLPTGDSQQVKRGDTQLAIFKVRGKYYCTQQMCPHKRAFVLSDGLIGEGDDKLWVSCPYHKRNYELGGADAGKCGNDAEMSIASFRVEERDDGWVYVELPPVEELDEALGTEKWKVREGETKGQFEELDKKMKRGRLGQRMRKDVDTNGTTKTNGNGNGTASIDW